MTGSRDLPDESGDGQRFTEVGAVAGGDVLQAATYAAGRDLSVSVGREPAAAALHQLPRDIPDFTNRDAELATLTDQVRRDDEAAASAVVISALAGKPGVGKSALAIHAAHRLKDDFPDGQLYVDLRGPEGEPADPHRVLDGFLRQLRVDDIPASLEARSATYRSVLSDLRVLVVLDNAANEEQVRPLLPGAASCGVIVTSRARLDALEGAETSPLEVLEDDDALELLAKLVGSERVDRERTAAESIIRLCGMLPLAIRIAGGRLRARPNWALEGYAKRLEDESRRLDELRLGDREVRASFALSYRSLDPDLTELFDRLGAVAGEDFVTPFAAALLDADLETTDEQLEKLVDAQLLESPAPTRYRFHDLLRLFARERLAQRPSGERQAIRETAVDWYVAVAGMAESIRTTGKVEWSERLAKDAEGRQATLDLVDRERTNFGRVIRDAHAHGLWDATWRLARRLMHVWMRYADWDEAEAGLTLALDAARQAGDDVAQGLLLNALGIVYLDDGRPKDGRRVLEQSLAIAQSLGIGNLERAVLGNLATAHEALGDREGALERHQRVRELCHEAGETRGEATARNQIGNLYVRAGDPERAIESYEEAGTLYRALDDRYSEGGTLLNRSVAYYRLGRLGDALSAALEQLEVASEFRDGIGSAKTLGHLGLLYYGLESWEDAAKSYELCATTWRLLGQPRRAAEACLGAYSAYLKLERGSEARDKLREALRLDPRVADELAGSDADD
ncbi:MAG TPA: tetratricopeptide repeat protein [Thermoleophilaceae bacterium]